MNEAERYQHLRGLIFGEDNEATPDEMAEFLDLDERRKIRELYATSHAARQRAEAEARLIGIDRVRRALRCANEG